MIIGYLISFDRRRGSSSLSPGISRLFCRLPRLIEWPGVLFSYIATLAAMGYCSSMNNERISTGFEAFFFERLSGLAGRIPHEFPQELIPTGHRPAAVLLMFWPVDSGSVEMVLTRRTEQVSSHRGQVSFPGGGVGDDETYESAALRESYEELGIAPELVTIMGRLDDAWSRNGHHVIPYVGWLEKRPAVTPNPREVAEVIFADMETLLRPESACEHRVQVDGEWHTTQAFRWDGGYVWGLTADLLLELLLWIQGVPSNRGPLRQQRMERSGL